MITVVPGQLPVPFSTLADAIPAQTFGNAARNVVRFSPISIPNSAPYAAQIRKVTSVSIPIILTFKGGFTDIEESGEWNDPSLYLDILINSQVIGSVPIDLEGVFKFKSGSFTTEDWTYMGGVYTQFQNPLTITNPGTLEIGAHGMLGLAVPTEGDSALVPSDITLYINADRIAAKTITGSNGAISYEDENNPKIPPGLPIRV